MAAHRIAVMSEVLGINLGVIACNKDKKERNYEKGLH
jgi:hypothetical protein